MPCRAAVSGQPVNRGNNSGNPVLSQNPTGGISIDCVIRLLVSRVLFYELDDVM